MFNFLKNIFIEQRGPTTPAVEVKKLLNGRFAIMQNGEIVKTYARRNDAVRGAKRMEMVIGG